MKARKNEMCGEKEKEMKEGGMKREEKSRRGNKIDEGRVNLMNGDNRR